MEPIEIVAIVVCAVIVLGVLISAIIRRVKGKTGCDCADCCGGPTSANQSNQRQKILFFLVKILHEPPRQGRFVFEGTQSLYIRGS